MIRPIDPSSDCNGPRATPIHHDEERPHTSQLCAKTRSRNRHSYGKFIRPLRGVPDEDRLRDELRLTVLREGTDVE